MFPRPWIGWLVVLLLGLGGGAGHPQGQEPSRPLPGLVQNYGNAPSEFLPFARLRTPYRRFFTIPLEFTGPGREKPEPKGLKKVLLGFLAPLEKNPEAFVGQSMLKGAQLAIEEANREGGYKGIPFALDVRNDLPLWGASGDPIIHFWDEGAWGAIGSVDGNNTHIALRVILKAEMPLINTAGTDPTLTETRIPWLLRTIPDDRQNNYALAWYLYKVKNFRRVAVLRWNARYGRVGVAELRDTSQRLGRPFVAEVRFGTGDTDFRQQWEVIRRARPDAVVLWGNPAELAPALKQMRALGLRQPVFACDRVVSPKFLQEAGPAAEGLVAVYPMNPYRSDPKWLSFRQRFRARFKEEPDHFAAYTYDGVRLLIQAIRQAGLNRPRIMDALIRWAMKPYEGVSGTLFFDWTLNNIMPPYLAQVRGGRFHFFEVRWDLEKRTAALR